jgi:hypothetical protein
LNLVLQCNQVSELACSFVLNKISFEFFWFRIRCSNSSSVAVKPCDSSSSVTSSVLISNFTDSWSSKGNRTWKQLMKQANSIELFIHCLRTQMMLRSCQLCEKYMTSIVNFEFWITEDDWICPRQHSADVLTCSRRKNW